MSTEAFSGKAEIYAKYRPSYPQQFIDYLYSEVGFDKDVVIADIGSGTGILSKQLLEKGSKIICVEPNDNMRQKAEDNLSTYSNFVSFRGTAEQTTLSDRSVDYITSAQAFHWFDANKFKVECQRILKPEGKVVLVWNSRVTNNELTKENGEICQRLCLNFKGFSGGREEDPESFSMFFRNGICDFRIFENNLKFTLDKFIGRNLSASYALKDNDIKYQQYIDELTGLFYRYSINGVLELPNFTHCYVGKV